MFDLNQWPDWLQATRLVISLALIVGFGVHAYRAHVRQADLAASSRRWIYGLYSLAFLGAAASIFAHLLVALAFKDYHGAGLPLALISLLLILSYAALLAGDRKKR